MKAARWVQAIMRRGHLACLCHRATVYLCLRHANPLLVLQWPSADAVTKAITGGQASAAAQTAAQAVNQSSAAASSTATALVQGFAQALQQNPSQALQASCRPAPASLLPGKRLVQRSSRGADCWAIPMARSRLCAPIS